MPVSVRAAQVNLTSTVYPKSKTATTAATRARTMAGITHHGRSRLPATTITGARRGDGARGVGSATGAAGGGAGAGAA